MSPHEVRLNQTLENSENLKNSENWNFETFQVFQCLVQSEVKKIILDKSSLHEVRLTQGQIDTRRNLLVTCVTLHSLIFKMLFRVAMLSDSRSI